MRRCSIAIAACCLLAWSLEKATADDDSTYTNATAAANSTNPLQGYYHGQDSANHLANSGALPGYPKELFKLSLQLSNDNAAIILTVSWAVLAVLSVIFTIVRVPQDAGPASLTAVLAAGIGLSASFLTYPQAQQNAALGAYATAQTAALSWMQTREKVYIMAGLGNSAAAFIGTLVVITTAQPYTWSPGHDPAIYCIISWALLFVSTVSGICSTIHAPPGRLLSRFRRFNVVLIGGITVLTGVAASVIAVVASAQFVAPYVACQSIGVAAVLCLSVYAVVSVVRDGRDDETVSSVKELEAF